MPRCLARLAEAPGPPAPPARLSSRPKAQACVRSLPTRPSQPRRGFRPDRAPREAQRPVGPAGRQVWGGETRTADPVGAIPPVDTDVGLGAEGGVGLQAGTLQARTGHEAAVEHAGLVVVLGGHHGVARREQAVGEGRVILRPATQPPSTPTHRPSWSLAQPVSPQNKHPWEDSVWGVTARPRGGGAAWGVEGGSKLSGCQGPGPPPATPGSPPDSTCTALGTRPSHAWPLGLAFLRDPSPERSAWPPAAALPGACSSASPPEAGEIGRSGKARGYVTRQLSPVDVRRPSPGPSAQYLPTAP